MCSLKSLAFDRLTLKPLPYVNCDEATELSEKSFFGGLGKVRTELRQRT